MTTRLQLEHLLAAALESRLAEVHVSLPCKVQSYDSEKNTVNVVPLLKRKRRSTLDGTTAASEIKALQNVPVAFFRTSKGWFTLPITAGDLGMVVFSERSLKDWMSKEKGEVVEPVDETLHPLDGAWFYPGGYPSKSPIASTNGSHVVIATDSGVEVHLGEAGLSNDQWVAIGKLVDDRLSSIQGKVDGHQHLFSVTLAPSGTYNGTTTGNTNGSIGTLQSVKATKVKAK